MYIPFSGFGGVFSSLRKVFGVTCFKFFFLTILKGFFRKSACWLGLNGFSSTSGELSSALPKSPGGCSAVGLLRSILCREPLIFASSKSWFAFDRRSCLRSSCYRKMGELHIQPYKYLYRCFIQSFFLEKIFKLKSEGISYWNIYNIKMFDVITNI